MTVGSGMVCSMTDEERKRFKEAFPDIPEDRAEEAHESFRELAKILARIELREEKDQAGKTDRVEKGSRRANPNKTKPVECSSPRRVVDSIRHRSTT